MDSNLYIDEDGSKYWHNDKDELHREDGPAIERISGTKYWYINDKLHREDGPAIEFCNGYKSWYYNGNPVGHSWWDGYTQEKFERYLRELKIKEYW